MSNYFCKFLKGITIVATFILTIVFLACNESTDINFEIEKIESLYVGDEVNLKVVFIDEVNKEEFLSKVEWKTSNESLATIDEDGKLIAISEGKVVVSAQIENVKKEIEITIIQKNNFDFEIKVIGFDVNSFIITETGTEVQFEAYKNDEKLDDVVWSVDSDIAQIDNTGKFFAEKVGKVIVAAEKNTVKKEIEVTINERFDFDIKQNNELITEDIVLEIGEELQFEAYNKDNKLEDVIWTVDNDIAQIDGTGKLAALKEGIVLVSAEINNLKKTVKVVINGPFDFEIKGSGYAVLDSLLQIELSYKDTYDVSFEYYFDNKFIEKTIDGLKAIACGETIITIKELNNNIEKTYKVFIYEISEQAITVYLENLYNNLEVSSNVNFVKNYYDSEIEFEYSSNDPKYLDENGNYIAPILSIDSELCIVYYIEEEEFVSFLPIVIKGWGTEFDVVLNYLDDQIPQETQRTLYLPTTYFYYDTVIDWYCNGELLIDGIFAFERNEGLNYKVNLKCVIKIGGKTEEKEYEVKCIMLDTNDKMLFTFDKYVNGGWKWSNNIYCSKSIFIKIGRKNNRYEGFKRSIEGTR